MQRFERPLAEQLRERLKEPPTRIQIVAGPRQVGKTTLVRQVLEGANRPSESYLYAATDEPERNRAATGYTGTSTAPAPGIAASAAWIEERWRRAERLSATWTSSDRYRSELKPKPFVLVLDEIQRVADWSRIIKGLWDDAVARGLPMHVVLLGSPPLLVQRGLTESLAGRYEVLHAPHWSFDEMNAAFSFTLDQYIHFGGFPGSVQHIGDEGRWRSYVHDSLIEPSIRSDVLETARVNTPALLRRLFDVGCASSGQILALSKISSDIGGHEGTLADHLALLGRAGLLSGLPKWANQPFRQRAAAPKLQVHNTALATAHSTYRLEDARADRTRWGRMVESAVGAHLLNTATPETKLYYWREGGLEVDFVVVHHNQVAAIEVKSAGKTSRHAGLDAFCRNNPASLRWLVGSDELPVGEFLRQPAAFWTRP